MAKVGDSGPSVIEAQLRAIYAALGAGSLSEVARLMGWPERTARNWSKRGRVPVGRLLEIARKTGVSVSRLEGRPNMADTEVAIGAHEAGSRAGYAPLEDHELVRLSDTAWPAFVVRKCVAAVRAAEEHAAVRLDGDQLADAVGIVVQMSAISTAGPQQLATSVIGTMVASGQVRKRKGDR